MSNTPGYTITCFHSIPIQSFYSLSPSINSTPENSSLFLKLSYLEVCFHEKKSPHGIKAIWKEVSTFAPFSIRRALNVQTSYTWLPLG